MKSSAPDVSRFWFVQSSDLETRLSYQYHESTKASEFLFSFGSEDPKRTPHMMRLINAVAGRTKSYPYAPRIALHPADWDTLSVPLGEVVATRRTRREFQPTAIGPRAFATLLIRGAGINGEIVVGPNETRPGRVYPSGGGLFPLEIYPLVLNVDGIPQGLYHFDPHSNSLEQLIEADLREKAISAFMGDQMAVHAAAALFVTAVFKRTSFKYGERAYRLVLIEAGHLVHSLALVGHALGLSVVSINGFFDRQIEALIDIDGIEESIIYPALVGGLKQT